MGVNCATLTGWESAVSALGVVRNGRGCMAEKFREPPLLQKPRHSDYLMASLRKRRRKAMPCMMDMKVDELGMQ